MFSTLWEKITSGLLFRRADETLPPLPEDDPEDGGIHSLTREIASAGGFHPRLFSPDPALTSFPVMMEELYESLA